MPDDLNGASPRKRGRPKGSPKVVGSGRAKGTANKRTIATREQILQVCNPLKLLTDVALGRPFFIVDLEDGRRRNRVSPTPDQIMNARAILAHKTAPNLRAQELSGPGGAPIETINISGEAAREVLVKQLHGMSERMVVDRDELPNEESEGAN